MRISVFGLGRAGTVSAACLASLDHSVTGLDTDEKVRRLVARGSAPFTEPGLDRLLQDGLSSARLTIAADPQAAVRSTELSLICVGTPPGAGGAFDAGNLLAVSRAIGAGLTRGHTVVVRSTVLPGTVDNVVVPALEETSGLREGDDFDVAVAPEFLREGTAIADFLAPAAIVIGARRPEVWARVASLFRGVEGPLSTASIEVAEMVKYASNMWHGLKVAFANEIGTYCRDMAIDGAEVMRIFAQDRKLNLSERYLQPGFAFGGPCLTKDIAAFVLAAQDRGLSLPVISSILPSNDKIIEDRLELILHTGKRSIGFLGLSYKPETDDPRSSSYLDLCRRLIDRGCDLRIFDPLMSRSASTRVSAYLANAMIADSVEEALADRELIVVGTPHQAFADVRRRLIPNQSLIDLARGTHETIAAAPDGIS